ncbi:hypothetical protein LCGC14_1634650 [marine sediment metagenome]|uniref:Uncharacterized protein n=1 Tax=marine sediment metagenome TaxID=412755 RepID=A0A0F9I1P1_9ZZZZ
MLALPFGLLFDGIVLSTLWEWFVVEQFALPSLSIVHAIGISILVSTLFTQLKVTSHLTKEQEKEHNWELLIKMLISPWILLLPGWITTLLM